MFRLFKQIYDSADVKVRNLLKVIRNRPFFDLSSFPLHSPLSQPLSISSVFEMLFNIDFATLLVSVGNAETLP